LVRIRGAFGLYNKQNSPKTRYDMMLEPLVQALIKVQLVGNKVHLRVAEVSSSKK